MKKNETKWHKLSEIGYHGKPADTLTKKELQMAFLEVVHQLSNCDCSNKSI